MNHADSKKFWSKVKKHYATKATKSLELRSIVVTHLVSRDEGFLDAVNACAPIVAIIPKPSSYDPTRTEWVGKKYPGKLWELNRNQINSSHEFLSEIRSRVGENPFVILDIGGYFAKVFQALVEEFGLQFLGVVEDTENGHQKYEQLSLRRYPVVSVARSPLKEPEDHLVGEAIVFSADAILREVEVLLIQRTTLVIGYGKIGQAIARRLAARGIQVAVLDINPAKMALARAHGFEVGQRTHLLQKAQTIFSATGSSSLSVTEFGWLRDDVFIFSATSSDDEFLSSIHSRQMYEIEEISEHITSYKYKNKRIHLVNNGNAVNFIHGGTVGPFIYLVQSELVAGITRLVELSSELADILESHQQNPNEPIGIEPRRKQLYSVENTDKQWLAEQWLEVFG